MKIEPRKKSNRGGYLMMPLVDNVPVPADKTWKKVIALNAEKSAG